MLNPKTNERELAYIVRIDDIKPIAGKDRVECAVVGGWTVMVRKGQFKPGDLGLYFEIDSKLPEEEPYMFLESKHFKIKTQRYKTPDGPFFSQGLLMSAEDFGGTVYQDGSGIYYFHINDKSYAKGEFLTKELKVTYADVADNKRKASSLDKYKLMAQRNGKLFKHQPFRWLMKRNWGKKLLFIFFGRKRDKKCGWPAWVVKTDEERIQNLVSRIPEFAAEEWIPTEKIDGTSTTFTMKVRGRKRQFFVCSRNVVFDKPNKKCFYETNVYTEMAEKYNIEKVLEDILKENPELDFVTIQGETYGEGIQKRDYSIKEHELRAFNLIYGFKDGTVKRFNPSEMASILVHYGIPCVPIFEKINNLPSTCEEILALAGGASALDKLPREGLVFRNIDGTKSFKAVDNEFLAKYHN